MDTLRPIVELFATKPERRFRRGDVILEAGQPVGAIHYLVSGNVRLVRPVAGQRLYLHIYTSGGLFPILPTLTPVTGPYRYEAMGDVVTRAVDMDSFRKMMSAAPDIQMTLLADSSVLLARILAYIQQLYTVQTDRKLLIVLSNFLNVFKLDREDGKNVSIPLALTCTELAGWANVRRETVSRILARLEAARLVLRRGARVTVRDPRRLRAAIEKPIPVFAYVSAKPRIARPVLAGPAGEPS
jgi:CRP-like cAMP-binding protein